MLIFLAVGHNESRMAHESVYVEVGKNGTHILNHTKISIFVPMDNFIVSARKYRPATFDTVVGQQHITGTLKNAIKNRQLAQAFLFCGPRGVGKTTCARILAKTINCEHQTANVEACGQCNSCKAFSNGNSFSIHELDAASNNSVDDIRSLIEQVRIPPQAGKYKIYIIDEVHMLSQQAFNAFLKTLEEPPSYAVFILATTEKHKILPTILSRCQIFDFNRINVEDMARHLADIAQREAITYDNDALHIIAQKADGGLRDALSMFDQIVSFSNKAVTYQAVIDNLNILDYDYYFKATEAIIKEDTAVALLTFDEILANGFDGSHFIGGLGSHFRNLLVAKEPATLKLLETSENIKQRYLQQSQQISAGMLLSALNIANQCEINYRTAKNQRLQVELALLKMCHIASAIQLARQDTSPPMPEQAEKKKPDGQVKQSQPPTTNGTDTPSDRQVESGHTPLAVTVSKTIQSQEVPSATPSEVVMVADTAPTKSLPDIREGQQQGSWGQVKLGHVIPDLSKIFDNEETEAGAVDVELQTGTAQEPFTEEDLLRQWQAFADQSKIENKINLFTLMTANAPKLLPDYRIEVMVENTIQQDLLSNSRIDILNELRVKLRNFSIDLIPVQLAEDVVRKPYTAQEKYRAMAAKNPALDLLRQTFDLGLE